MRLDKYLKVSRLIKRRTVANEACDHGLVEVNGKAARASYEGRRPDYDALWRADSHCGGAVCSGDCAPGGRGSTLSGNLAEIAAGFYFSSADHRMWTGRMSI